MALVKIYITIPSDATSVAVLLHAHTPCKWALTQSFSGVPYVTVDSVITEVRRSFPPGVESTKYWTTSSVIYIYIYISAQIFDDCSCYTTDETFKTSKTSCMLFFKMVHQYQSILLNWIYKLLTIYHGIETATPRGSLIHSAILNFIHIITGVISQYLTLFGEIKWQKFGI